MRKVYSNKNDFSPIKREGTSIILSYGYHELEDNEATWYEVSLPKNHYPCLTFEDVQDAIVSDINDRITNQIVGGFKWENKPVWYSLENQINFSLSVAPVNLKIGEYEDGSPVYVEFATSEELKAFNDACLVWKNQCLEAGRAEKEGIDWQPYKDYFPSDEPIEV